MPPKPTPQITSSALPSSLSTNIHHLTRTLSTATGLDAFLATACYTSLFLHTQLPYFTGGFLRASSRVPTGSPALKALYNALEDHRIFSRLFGLFPLYTSVVEAWRKPHRDPAVKTLLYASLAAGTVFQVLENVALLVGKGVFRGERLRDREGWFWAVSNRFWLAQLGLEMLRLARVRQLRFREELGAERMVEPEKETVWGEAGQDGVAERTQELMEASTKQLIKVQSVELEKRWWRQLYVTAASIPLAVHWSFEDFSRSPVSEALFAGCGVIAGIIGLQDAWEESA
ncbi:hypothetical protein MBLNU13_g02674t1 [Cladosporium sp. NU13]